METPKKIRLGEAAAAIGTTSKALTHWMSRYGEQGLKPTAEQTGGWREFNWGDVAALAITKVLVDLGMSSHGAFTVAMGIIKARWPTLFDDDPHWTITHKNWLMQIYLTRDGEWGFHGFEEAKNHSVDPESYAEIMLMLVSIISDAFAALKDMGHSPPKCDNSEIAAALKRKERKERDDKLSELLNINKDT